MSRAPSATLFLAPASREARAHRPTAVVDALAAEAIAHWEHGRSAAAAATIRRAIDLAPERSDLLLVAAQFVFERLDIRLAEPLLERALRMAPTSAEVHECHAILRQREGRLDDAADWARRAAVLSGRLAHRVMALEYASALADWRDYSTVVPLLTAEVLRGLASEDRPRFLGPYHFATDDPEAQLAIAETAAARARAGIVQPSTLHARRPGERLRIAYLSGDFREHPVPMLLESVLEHHDRSRFEVLALSVGPDDRRGVRERIRAVSDRFEEFEGASDREIAERIRALRIDVLVDLSGHSTHGRPRVLAMRPAPHQVSWLGYTATMGSGLVDCAIVDPWVAPQDAERHFAERLVRLPRTYFPPATHRAVAEPRPRESYGLPARGVVLCSFNAAYKITPECFAAWLCVLARVPGSVLWLAALHPTARRNLRAAAAAAGVDPARIVFAEREESHADHLARYRVADLAIDTFPYNSHTTASDALHAGCPLVTRSGRAFASRVAGSLLRASGLADFVTRSADEFVSLTVDLARDPERVAAVAACLRCASPAARAADETAFVADLERAYADLCAVAAP